MAQFAHSQAQIEEGGATTLLPPAAISFWQGRKSAASALEFEIVSEVSQLRALKRDWNLLYARSREAYLSQSYDWCLKAWETVAAPRGRELYCLIAREHGRDEGGRIVLIWPLVKQRREFWSILRPLGAEASEYGAVLVEDGLEAELRVWAAWRYLTRSCGVDVIQLPPVPVQSKLGRGVEHDRAARASFRNTLHAVRWQGFKSWEQYHATLSGERRRGARKRRRYLAELGEVRSEQVTDPLERRRIVEWLLRQKSGWLEKTERSNPWLADTEYRDFLYALVTDPVLAAEHAVFALTLGGKIIAGALLGVDKLRAEGFLSAFDPAYARYSPGQMLLEDILKWSFAMKRDCDLRIGDEPYKRIWANETSEAVNYHIANSSWGVAYVVAVSARYRGYQLRIGLRRFVPKALKERLKATLKAPFFARPTTGGKSAAPASLA